MFVVRVVLVVMLFVALVCVSVVVAFPLVLVFDCGVYVDVHACIVCFRVGCCRMVGSGAVTRGVVSVGVYLVIVGVVGCCRAGVGVLIVLMLVVVWVVSFTLPCTLALLIVLCDGLVLSVVVCLRVLLMWMLVMVYMVCVVVMFVIFVLLCPV